jgi:microcystin-dependent protein
MANPFLGEIRIFTGNFPPTGWAFCNGQLLPISQNTALFSLLGTMYGGNGTTTFALPNLQASVPLGQGQGPGLTPRTWGETGGESAVSLLASEMPAHTHTVNAVSEPGDGASPGNDLWAASVLRDRLYATGGTNATMSPAAIGVAGGSLPHNNMQPYLGLNFIIALQGVFPPRS